MLEFENVTKQYRSGVFGNIVTNAVDDVSFSVGENERIGLLGESGCGKTTIARLATKLLLPSAGRILYEGKNISKMSAEETKTFRRGVQIIFQNPQLGFNPRMKLYDTIAEPLRIYGVTHTREEERAVIDEYMSLLGLPEDIFGRYPHEISGGQAQRIAIMRIVMLEPRLIIADEPTTMLDVSVQAQILNMLRELLDRKKTSLLFVSHDLDVIRAMCGQILVINCGRIVERGSTEEIFKHPQNEYTQYLVGNSLIPVGKLRMNAS